MLEGIRKRISPSMIVSFIALFVSLSGAAYAVTTLPANSVGTKQLKDDAVIGSKVKNATITGDDIREGTLGPVPSTRAIRRWDISIPPGNTVSLKLPGAALISSCAHAGTYGTKLTLKVKNLGSTPLEVGAGTAVVPVGNVSGNPRTIHEIEFDKYLGGVRTIRSDARTISVIYTASATEDDPVVPEAARLCKVQGTVTIAE